jgi:hypothetical protein
VITKEKFIPRNRDTMIWLWGIYLGLNLLETLLLCLGGMSVFDSLCHSFGTVSTSGYSPWNASIGHYNNAYFDWVIILFMFLGGMTFMLFYHMMQGNWRVIRINTEFRWYVGFMLFFCGMVSWILWKENTYGSLIDSIRYATFQVTSILTTTGFTTADYEQWPQAAQMFLYAVCFRRLCRVDHQRYQGRSLCPDMEIRRGGHKAHLFPTHGGGGHSYESASGRFPNRRFGRLLFYRQYFSGAGRGLFHGAGGSNGLSYRHEFGDRNPDEHWSGIRRCGTVPKLRLYFRYG